MTSKRFVGWDVGLVEGAAFWNSAVEEMIEEFRDEERCRRLLDAMVWPNVTSSAEEHRSYTTPWEYVLR
jgi:hypothetical protein